MGSNIQNWFDKKELWGSLELRLPANDQARAYYDYLTNSNSVISLSTTFGNPGRNTVVEEVTYEECIVEENDVTLEIAEDHEEDSENIDAWTDKVSEQESV